MEMQHSVSPAFVDFFSLMFQFFTPDPVRIAPERTDVPEPETALERLELAVPAIVDLRGEKRTKSRGKAKGKRRWDRIDAITWHQTAVYFENPNTCLNFPVHAAIMPDGTVVLLHDPTSLVWHAHSLNGRSIGIEIVCMAAGIEGNDRTRAISKKINPKTKKKWTREEWLERKPTRECTDAQIESAKALARYYAELVEENEGSVAYQHTHRQGHSSRIGDPGSRIFKMIVEPSAAELKHTIRYHWARGSGKHIPRYWSPKGDADYSWRFKQP